MIKMDYGKYLQQSAEWKEKEIILCGLDIISFGVINYLNKSGKQISGIVEKSCEKETGLFGTQLYPFSYLEEGRFKDCFFIITAFKEKHRRKYAELITEKYGAENYVIIANPTEVRIDISGVCNLRCPSCQVGNHGKEDFDYSGRGFMDVEMFQKILDKVQQEIPENPAVYLFTLGEPVLHPDIAKMIDYIHECGLMAIVSTNLSYKKNLETFMKSEPDVLKISLSGFTQEVYGTTHCGGNVELVKENMKEIARLIQRYKLKTKVMVGYHVYNNNRGTELEAMQRLSQELGFLFQPVNAMYFNMLKRTGHTAFTQEDRAFIRNYYDNAEEILCVPEAQEESSECRNYRDKLFIDYDGKVMLCELFHKEGKYQNYLDVSYDEIQKWRKEHWICQRCRRYGMHLK